MTSEEKVTHNSYLAHRERERERELGNLIEERRQRSRT